MDKGLDITMLRAFLACHAAAYLNPKFAFSSSGGPDGLNHAAEAGLRWLRARAIEPGWDAADRALEWLAAPEHHLVVYQQHGYPERLGASSAPPLLLFVNGDPKCLCEPQLAVVGSRQATPNGLDIARTFSQALAALGVVVTSGLARGIDGAAHRGALAAGGKTVAVLGCSIDHIYPRQHCNLATEIAKNGALVSEFPFGVAPWPANFPRRNRIISGLAAGTLVVEALLRSGSLSTAIHALEQGREVFAVPGSILSPLSKGPHSLIKQGAKLVEDIADIVDEIPEFHSRLESNDRGVPTRDGATRANPADHQFLRACGWDLFTADDIVARSTLTVQEVSSMLLKLELAGIIQVQGTGSYLRIR
jgi:DNA processing protein